MNGSNNNGEGRDNSSNSNTSDHDRMTAQLNEIRRRKHREWEQRQAVGTGNPQVPSDVRNDGNGATTSTNGMSRSSPPPKKLRSDEEDHRRTEPTAVIATVASPSNPTSTNITNSPSLSSTATALLQNRSLVPRSIEVQIPLDPAWMSSTPEQRERAENADLQAIISAHSAGRYLVEQGNESNNAKGGSDSSGTESATDKDKNGKGAREAGSSTSLNRALAESVDLQSIIAAHTIGQYLFDDAERERNAGEVSEVRPPEPDNTNTEGGGAEGSSECSTASIAPEEEESQAGGDVGIEGEETEPIVISSNEENVTSSHSSTSISSDSNDDDDNATRTPRGTGLALPTTETPEDTDTDEPSSPSDEERPAPTSWSCRRKYRRR